MIDKMKILQMRKLNHDYQVMLTYDKCKSGESQYGPWNLYGVEYEGTEQSMFAEDSLHLKLMKYGKGTHLILRRNQIENGQLEWQVTPANCNARYQPQQSVKYIDDRTLDIHRQVALKIATISIGHSTKPWVTEDLKEIKVRMDKLLEILDGRVDSELPF
ncbi:MAG: hypothetical protein V3W20_04975 [Candidatus Neomarinimicrobiota bacterium]